MGTLHQLKGWYSFEETAERLSQSFGEAITDKDVIQLAAEGKLKCAWLLNGAHYARRVTAICVYPRDQRMSVYSEPVFDSNGESWGESLAGIYSLPVDWCPSWGWWILTFVGLGGESSDLCGPLVVGEDGVTWELYDEASNGGSDFFHFPQKHEVVFRPEDIEAFELANRNLISGEQQDRRRYTWDTHANRKLLDESKEPGMTQAKLAEKYAVSRAFIGKQLGKAKEEFEPRKANPFDALGSRNKKK